MKLTSIICRLGVVAAGAALLIAVAILSSGTHPSTALADHKEGHTKGGGNDGGGARLNRLSTTSR